MSLMNLMAVLAWRCPAYEHGTNLVSAYTADQSHIASHVLF
jgi:hypothetical protein